MPWWITDGVLQKADSAPNESSIPTKITGKGKVMIPDGVISIADETFRSCTGMESIVLPDSLSEIGKDAFRGCAELTHILLPNGVTYIGETAFCACLMLKLVELPDSVSSIGDGAFSECRQLTRILLSENHPHFRVENDMLISKDGTLLWAAPNIDHAAIPEGVTEIGNAVFGGRRSLLRVSLPDSLMRIGKCAFYWCDNLSEVSIPNGVMEIGDEAFAYCRKLSDISLPSGIEQLEYSTFEGCSALTSITLPDGLKRIETKTFRWCSGLTHIVLPEGLENIGDAAFCHCTKLTNLFIPDSVTSIGICAFDGCGSLKKITLSNNVTELGAGAFEGFRSLSIPAHLWTQLDKDTLNGLDALACPIPLKDAPAYTRLKLCVGFASARSGYPAELHAEYLMYIRKNASKLVTQAFEYPELLRLMCHEKLISAKDIDAFTAEAIRREDTELTAVLLNYQSSVLTMQEVFKARERKEKTREQQDEVILDRILARADKVGIEGLNFVVTGSLNHFAKRDDLKAFITERGGRLLSAMSAKTDYLITNDINSGSAKNQKAAELGIVVITEEEFLNMAQKQPE